MTYQYQNPKTKSDIEKAYNYLKERKDNMSIPAFAKKYGKYWYKISLQYKALTAKKINLDDPDSFDYTDLNIDQLIKFNNIYDYISKKELNNIIKDKDDDKARKDLIKVFEKMDDDYDKEESKTITFKSLNSKMVDDKKLYYQEDLKGKIVKLNTKFKNTFILHSNKSGYYYLSELSTGALMASAFSEKELIAKAEKALNEHPEHFTKGIEKYKEIKKNLTDVNKIPNVRTASDYDIYKAYLQGRLDANKKERAIPKYSREEMIAWYLGYSQVKNDVRERQYETVMQLVKKDSLNKLTNKEVVNIILNRITKPLSDKDIEAMFTETMTVYKKQFEDKFKTKLSKPKFQVKNKKYYLTYLDTENDTLEFKITYDDSYDRLAIYAIRGGESITDRIFGVKGMVLTKSNIINLVSGLLSKIK